METLLDRIKITNYLRIPYPTYAELTMEFWSSVSVPVISRKPLHEIHFRMNGSQRSITKDNINEICGFRRNGTLYTGKPWEGPHAHRENWFRQQICQNALPGEEHKSLTIMHPVFRYIQKLIAMFIHGQPDNNTFTREDTWLLYTMIFSDACPELRPCVGTIIIRAIKNFLDNGFQQGTHLPFGCLITRIHEFLGLNRSYPYSIMHCMDKTPRLLDIIRLCNASQLVFVSNGLFYVGYDNLIYKIPWPGHITVSSNTWGLPSEEYLTDFSPHDVLLFSPTPMGEDP